MEYYRKLRVDPAMLSAMDSVCEKGLEDSNGEVLYDKEVVFKNGMRVAIQLIESESDIDEEFPPPAWTQGVLFTPEGQELSCTEVRESLSGVYHCPDGDDVYVVEVVGG